MFEVLWQNFFGEFFSICHNKRSAYLAPINAIHLAIQGCFLNDFPFDPRVERFLKNE
jgi:hypothetical protein